MMEKTGIGLEGKGVRGGKGNMNNDLEKIFFLICYVLLGRNFYSL